MQHATTVEVDEAFLRTRECTASLCIPFNALFICMCVQVRVKHQALKGAVAFEQSVSLFKLE